MVRDAVPPSFPSSSLSAQRVAATPSGDTGGPRIEGVYIISVAARLLEMHPQTLRKYERVGLVRPSRTIGMLRLYSEQDIARLRLIKHLVDEMRINLAGVEFVLAMAGRLLQAKDRISDADEERRFMEVVGEELQELLGMLNIAGESR